MDLVLTQLAKQKLTEGIDPDRWKYSVKGVIRVEPETVVAEVEPSELSSDPRSGACRSRRVLVAERLNQVDVSVARVEAELWCRAAERAPKLIVPLVEFIPVNTQCCLFIYESFVPVELKSPLGESDLVRIVSQAFCLLRICEELAMHVQCRLAPAEFSLQGKIRGFGPGVVHRLSSCSDSKTSKRARAISSTEEKDAVLLLGVLMGDLIGGHDALYSNHLLRLQTSCLRESPEARPSFDIVERKLYRQIQRLSRISSEGASLEARDEAPSTPETSDVGMPSRSHDDLADMLDQWPERKAKTREVKAVCFDISDPSAGGMKELPFARAKARDSTDSKRSEDDLEMQPSLIESDIPQRNPDRIEQITQLAFGTMEQIVVVPQCLRTLVVEAYIYVDTTAIDTVLKTLRRRVLQYSLHAIARLKALYIIHVLLTRGPRSVFHSVATYMDFVSLLRASAQRTIRTEWRQSATKPMPLGSWMQGLSHRLQDAARVIRRDQENNRADGPESQKMDKHRVRGIERYPRDPREVLDERTNALTSAYGAVIMSKVDALRLWRDQSTTIHADSRHQSKRLAMASALLRISKMAGKLAEELFANQGSLPMRDVICDELILEILFGLASVANVLAPRLSASEKEKLSNELMMILRRLSRLFAITIPWYTERNHEQLARTCRGLWSLSQNHSLDQRGLFTQVASRLPEELAIGCGLRASDSFATLPEIALIVFRSLPKTTTSNGPDTAAESDLTHLDAKKSSVERTRARSKSTSSVPSNHARVVKPPLAPALLPANLPRNLDIDWSSVELIEELGRGSFGTVYKAKYLGHVVAVKIFEIGRSCSQGDQYRNFYAEVRTLCNLEHENILQFIGAGRAPTPPRLFIVTEFMSRGTLFDLLHRRREMLSPLRKKSMALDVCRGMAYLHDRGHMHRDLKSSNLLVDSSYRVKIGDFGLAKSIRYLALCQPMTGNCGTPQYMAPEVLASAPYGAGADVFSFGVLLWELLAEALPYAGIEPARVITAVLHMNERPPLDPRWHPELVSLLRDCWDRNPARRPTFQALVKRLPPIPFPAPIASESKQSNS
jgi:hypothetical protein